MAEIMASLPVAILLLLMSAYGIQLPIQPWSGIGSELSTLEYGMDAHVGPNIEHSTFFYI